MPTIELPELASGSVNENEPTAALKLSGWADGDQVPASVLNWAHRTTYDTLRAMLGLHLANAVGNFAQSPVMNTGANYDLQAVGIDPISGYIITTSLDTVAGNMEITRSVDGGLLYGVEYGVSHGAVLDMVAIAPGVHASIIGGTSNSWWFAPYPYDTWTLGANLWGAKAVDYLVADIGDGHGPSLLVLTANGSIWVTSATVAPSDAFGYTDWTQYDISSVMDTPTSFAINPDTGILVVAGSDTGGGGGLTAWCDVANGVAAGDFSGTFDHGGTTCTGIAHNGERFVVTLAGTSFVDWGLDGASWYSVAPPVLAALSGTYQVLIADRETGFFWVFDGETGSAACSVAVSRDGLAWVPGSTTAQNIYVDGTLGPAPKLDPVRKRFIAPSYNAGGVVRRYAVQTI